MSTCCFYTLVRLNQHTHEDPVYTANREEVLLGPGQRSLGTKAAVLLSEDSTSSRDT